MLKDQTCKKVVLCGGGTGGHIFPSIAIGEILKKKGCDLYYIGVNGKPEEDLADEHGIDFYGYEFSGFPRKFKKELFSWPFNLLKAVSKAKLYLKHFKPDIIFGTGGYSAAPVIIAAQRLGIPFIIHNLDVRIGLANQFCSNGAKLITLGFESSHEYPKNITTKVTGNPVRERFIKTDKLNKKKICKEFGLSPDKKTIFVVGGSQGANAINEAILEIIKDLVLTYDIQVIHQTGEPKHEALIKRIPAKVEQTNNYVARPFYENPEECFFISDLVIARSGAMTTTEISLMGNPAIFIPYPFAGNHQEANAMHLVDSGGAILIRQKDLRPKLLLNTITELITDEKKLDKMATITKSFAKPNAAYEIADLILSNIESNTSIDKEIFSTTL
ncbi:MAG: undecaprenyldiphospho-muramoylpentapeptide beta-N-acetylglucosaminyltransferase [Candidatus Melainabacteria bacterium]|nr:undecaprenyldiphospho-muramoylpentapeptide beta-N-acetylglucosaminyltransferase [Candidatus Melainabacteria bacterium]